MRARAQRPAHVAMAHASCCAHGSSHDPPKAQSPLPPLHMARSTAGCRSHVLSGDDNHLSHKERTQRNPACRFQVGQLALFPRYTAARAAPGNQSGCGRGGIKEKGGAPSRVCCAVRFSRSEPTSILLQSKDLSFASISTSIVVVKHTRVGQSATPNAPHT